MLKYFLLIIGLVFWCNTDAQKSTLTLEQCLESTKTNSKLLAIKPIQAAALLAKTKRLNRNFWPQMSLEGQASWQSEVLSIPINLPGIEVPSPQAEQYRLSLNIQQTLWDGGVNKAQKEQAVAMNLANNAEIDVSFHQVKTAVEQLFYGALMADWQSQYTQLILDNLNEQLTKVQAAADNGLATPADVMRLQAKQIDLQQKMIESTHLKAATLLALAEWTALPIEEETVIVAPEISWEQKTIQRAETKLLDAKMQTINTNEQLLKASNRPKIGVYANLGYGQPGLNLLSDQWNTYALLGAKLSVPLSYLYSSSQKLDRQQLSLQKEQLALQKEQFLQQTNTQRIAQTEEIDRLQAIEASDNELLQLRNAIAETAAVQLKEGIITSADYISAITDKELANEQLILHRIQKLKAITAYNRLSGE